MAATSPPVNQLCQEIVDVVKRNIEKFYADHPQWWDDPRSQANIDSRWECAREILRLVNRYDIRIKVE